MKCVEGAIHIASPIEAVWDYLTKFDHVVDWLPHCKRASDWTVAWTFELMGVSFHITARVTSSEPPRFLQVRTEGQIESVWDMDLTPVDGETKLSIVVRYLLPSRLTGTFPEDTLDAVTQQVLDQALVNLRFKLERVETAA